MEKIVRHNVIRKISQLRRDRLVRNASSIIIGKVVQSVFGLLVGLLTARYLGPSNYGLISYAAAYVAFFATACSLGTNNLLVKEFVDYPGEEGLIIGSSIVMRLLSSVLAILIIVVISCIIDAGEKTTVLVVGISSMCLVFQQPAEVFDYWLQSRLESKITAGATLIAYTVATSFKLYFLITQKSVLFFAVITSLDYLCLGLLLSAWYKKHNGPQLRYSFDYAKRLLSKSYHLIISGMMFAIYSQVDKLMLKHISGESQVGYYAVAYSLCTMWCFVLGAIITSFYPSIMEADKNGDELLFEKKNRQLYAIVFYVSTFVSVILAVFATPIVRILYGEYYMPCVPLVRIITWYTCFSYIGTARAAWTVAKGFQKHLYKINLLSAIANVFLNLLLIPSMGAVGAALASLIAHMLITVFFPFFIKDMRKNSILIIEAMLLKGVLWGKSQRAHM